MLTIADLERGLAAVRGSVRMGMRRGLYVCIIEVSGGSATFTNISLAVAIEAALRFLYAQTPRTVAAAAIEPFEPAVADPEGAKVGPAPNGTHVGVIPQHCARCGYGEQDGQYICATEDSGILCPHCGGRNVCTLPPLHDGNHDPCEAGEENVPCAT